MDLRPEDADRVLTAAAAGEAADGSVAGVLLVRLGAGVEGRDPSPALVAALVARLEASAPRPLVRRVAVTGIATVVVLGGTAAASSGSLPAPVQRVVHDVAAVVGADLPDPDEPADRGGRVAGPDEPARGASTSSGAGGGADPATPGAGGSGGGGAGSDGASGSGGGGAAGDRDEDPRRDGDGDGDEGHDDGPDEGEEDRSGGSDDHGGSDDGESEDGGSEDGGSDDEGTQHGGSDDGERPGPTSPPPTAPPATTATAPPGSTTPATSTSPGPARVEADGGPDRSRPDREG